MIGFLCGEVVFSDGKEIILLTNSGIGHQIYFQKVLAEGQVASCFVSHIVKEDSEELFGFESLREKKLFELLLSVKGVGPKSAFSMVNFLGIDPIIHAISVDSKDMLKKTPGVGPKAAAQMILDLKNKVSKIKMYSDKKLKLKAGKLPDIDFKRERLLESEKEDLLVEEPEDLIGFNETEVLDDTLLACRELGFSEDKIIPIAQKIIKENQIFRAEQLVHLVLKEV